MRELKVDEIGSVSGGAGENDPLRKFEVVTVYGNRLDDSEGGGFDSRWFSNGNNWGGIAILAQGDDNSGGGGWGDYDPSPDDGIYGLDVQINPDGSYSWETELRGFFDLNGSNAPDPGEGPYDRGHTGDTVDITHPDWDNVYDRLATFTPYPEEVLWV
ncbi:MAG: hypothetical protein AAF768_10230 [Pseudomonadota bacterium]